MNSMGKKYKGMHKDTRRKDKGRGQESRAEVWRGGLVWVAIRAGDGAILRGQRGLRSEQGL